jgi:hypothetical protein
MADERKDQSGKPKIEDLGERELSAEEQAATKGGNLPPDGARIRFAGGIGSPPSNSLPVMTSDSHGGEVVDGS